MGGGIALALAEAGATVYLTGRTRRGERVDGLEGGVFDVAAVAALASDPRIMAKTGRALVAAELALEYGFTDIDGKQPEPLTLETA